MNAEEDVLRARAEARRQRLLSRSISRMSTFGSVAADSESMSEVASPVPQQSVNDVSTPNASSVDETLMQGILKKDTDFDDIGMSKISSEQRTLRKAVRHFFPSSQKSRGMTYIFLGIILGVLSLFNILPEEFSIIIVFVSLQSMFHIIFYEPTKVLSEPIALLGVTIPPYLFSAATQMSNGIKRLTEFCLMFLSFLLMKGIVFMASRFVKFAPLLYAGMERPHSLHSSVNEEL